MNRAVGFAAVLLLASFSQAFADDEDVIAKGRALVPREVRALPCHRP